MHEVLPIYYAHYADAAFTRHTAKYTHARRRCRRKHNFSESRRSTNGFRVLPFDAVDFGILIGITRTFSSRHARSYVEER